MLIVDKPMPTNCYDCALDCCWDEGTIPAEYAEKRKLNCPIKGELVRCGECKHYKDGMCYNPNTYDDEKTCGNTTADWFCADGKRKDYQEVDAIYFSDGTVVRGERKDSKDNGN